MLGKLFFVFLKIGAVSFGGGYAVIPLIQHETAVNEWLTSAEFKEAVALSGMAPGPIAANCATLIGYGTAGIAGAIASTLGMILPSLVVVVIFAAFFIRYRDNKRLKASFYGLRPVIAGLIVYAAFRFGIPEMEPGYSFGWTTAVTLCIGAGCLFAMFKYKPHPLTVILASGVAGIVFF